VNLAAFVGQNDVSGFSPLATAADLRAAFAAGDPAPFVLDVRTAREFATSRLRGTVNVPVDDLRQRWETLPRDRRIWVVCRSAFRGHLAVRILKERGFDDVVNVTGGHLSVVAAGGFALEEGPPSEGGSPG
jgi:rhodanese-related sulfurtransferase